MTPARSCRSSSPRRTRPASPRSPPCRPRSWRRTRRPTSRPRPSRAAPRTATRCPPRPAAGTAPARSTTTTSGSAATSDGLNCVDIPGATGPTYTLTDADVGSTVRSTVQASNDVGSEVEVSAVSAVVEAAAPVEATPPVVSGTPRDGAPLSATTGHLGRHRPLRLRLPVAALRRLRPRLRGHPGRDLQHLRADGRRRRPHPRHRRHGDQRRRQRDRDLRAHPRSWSPIRLSNESPPVVAGTAVDGETITATPGTWDGTARSTTRTRGSAATPPAWAARRSRARPAPPTRWSPPTRATSSRPSSPRPTRSA